MFSAIRVLPEAERFHMKCEAPSIQMVVGLAQCETTSETDRSTAGSILNENAENHQVTFEYNGQRAVLWIRPYITYVKLAKMLGGIFSIPDDYKITFIFEVDQTATAITDSISTAIDSKFGTARLPSTGVVTLSAVPQT
uniref:Lipoprotein n=1 Tax=Haemonchus contortus TaxID=6289 RepID=A0A7I5EB62_HAECO